MGRNQMLKKSTLTAKRSAYRCRSLPLTPMVADKTESSGTEMWDGTVDEAPTDGPSSDGGMTKLKRRRRHKRQSSRRRRSRTSRSADIDHSDD